MKTSQVRLVLAALLLPGCVSLTPAGERVEVVRNPLHVQRCVSLGQVEASSVWGGTLTKDAGHANNRATMQNETARRGGDTLLLLDVYQAWLNRADGEAYRCR